MEGVAVSGSGCGETFRTESLTETIRFIKGLPTCIVLAQGISLDDEDDGFGKIIPSCQENTLSRVNPQSKVFAAILGGTIIGPVIEVQIVKILDQYGLEIASPSPNDTERTSHVMIDFQREESVRG